MSLKLKIFKKPSRDSLFKGAFGIPDNSIDEFLSMLSSKKAIEWLRNTKTDAKFISAYKSWLFSNKIFSIHGIDENKFQTYITLGTTQSFHDFYQIHPNKTLKIRKGEYPYHKGFFNSIGRKWAWIDDEGVCLDDFVVLSHPFSGNGKLDLESIEILKLCNKKSVPVLLDCAFWGLSTNFSFSLSEYPCIQIISFSLSKFFNIGRLRIGMMYSQYKEQASGAILAYWNYINSWSAYIGFQLINNFSIDYMNKKYRSIQEEICSELDISPSQTLLFGIGTGDKWKSFSRDNKFNRVCLSQAIYERYQNHFSQSIKL